MNIILVIFDSLRKDCVGTYGQTPCWGYRPETPHFDALAKESLVFARGYPESLPTLPTRRAIYTGQRVYPFHNADFRLKGDFVGAPGWGPIPEEQPTLAERLKEAGYRTGLIADVYHMFKPSKNYWRGFDQWMFLRGQEQDPMRSGPHLTSEQVDYWLPKFAQTPHRIDFINQCVMNIHDRNREEDYFAARVLKESALWLEQNQDADPFFLTVESFDPHEPWHVPAHYRRLYSTEEAGEQVLSTYRSTEDIPEELMRRTQANYAGLVTFCDRWFGFFMEQMRVMGLLENTLLLFTADHGHSIGDYGYIGKRGYPSQPDVFDVPIIVRRPDGAGAGQTSDLIVQHTDLSAEILKAAGLDLPDELDGQPFVDRALDGGPPLRDHATVGWGSAVTVVKDNWWFNAKANGKGAFLHDMAAEEPFARNLADDHPEVVNDLFAAALADAKDGIPDWIMDLAEGEADAPGCSALAART